MKTAFVFPGQGSQKVGMLQDLYNAYPIVKQRFEEADEALGYSISKLCFEGPDTELVKTANTQPAILTASVACYEVLKEQGFIPDIVGGHSLGEYSALVAAGVLDFKDAVYVVHNSNWMTCCKTSHNSRTIFCFQYSVFIVFMSDTFFR
jgi:[acyl-carrier-protein] S-malonyltransferase